MESTDTPSADDSPNFMAGLIDPSVPFTNMDAFKAFQVRHPPSRIGYVPCEEILIWHHGNMVLRKKSTWKHFEEASGGFRHAKEYQRKFAKIEHKDLRVSEAELAQCEIDYRDHIKALTLMIRGDVGTQRQHCEKT